MKLQIYYASQHSVNKFIRFSIINDFVPDFYDFSLCYQKFSIQFWLQKFLFHRNFKRKVHICKKTERNSPFAGLAVFLVVVHHKCIIYKFFLLQFQYKEGRIFHGTSRRAIIENFFSLFFRPFLYNLELIVFFKYVFKADFIEMKSNTILI